MPSIHSGTAGHSFFLTIAKPQCDSEVVIVPCSPESA
jgi:hypothetical protein